MWNVVCPNDPKTLATLEEMLSEFPFDVAPNITDIKLEIDERVGCTRYDFAITMSTTSYAKNKEEVDLLKMTQELLKNGTQKEARK